MIFNHSIVFSRIAQFNQTGKWPIVSLGVTDQ